MHDQLHLKAEQEAAWQSFSSQWQAPPPPPPPPEKPLSAPEQMEEHLKQLQQRETHLKSQLQVVKVFYAQLSPEQRTIFDLLHRPVPRPGRPPRP